jgi:uncharacterized protein YjcR
MEPQMIDHYNELPHAVNVIDKMNEELYETQNELFKAKCEIDILKSTDDQETIEELETDLEISREEKEELKNKYESLTSSFDNMKEFIESNYEGSEVVSSEYIKICEDVLKLYKEKYGKQLEEEYMKECHEKKNKEWWKGLRSFINTTM